MRLSINTKLKFKNIIIEYLSAFSRNSNSDLQFFTSKIQRRVQVLLFGQRGAKHIKNANIKS